MIKWKVGGSGGGGGGVINDFPETRGQRVADFFMVKEGKRRKGGALWW